MDDVKVVVLILLLIVVIGGGIRGCEMSGIQKKIKKLENAVKVLETKPSCECTIKYE